jgi:hypothetical protein
MPRDLDRSALPCPLHPTPKSRARKTSPAASEQSRCPGLVRTRGARAKGPWWLEECGLARSPAPHRRGMPAPSGREAGPPSRKASRKPWAVSSRSALRGPNPPSPARAARKTPPGAAGTCQASVRGDAASARGPGRPSKPCGSDAAGGTLMRRNRFRPFARDTLAPSTPMGQAPALTGAKLHKLPARRYGSRQPELTASRRPGLRGPRPSVQDGRQDKCGTGREGVEKIVRIFRAMRWGRLETTGEQLMSLRQA